MNLLKDICGSLLRRGELLCCMGLLTFAAKGYDFAPLPEVLDGTMRGVALDTARMFNIPDSVAVLKVSYMSRHGARYLSSPKKIAGLEKGLEEARKAGTLTTAGEDFSRLVDYVKKNSEGKWGLLTPLGRHEEEVIGETFGRKVIARLHRDNASQPSMNRDSNENRYVRQTAISSYVPRVVETMYCFDYHTLLGCKQTTINNSEGRQFNSLTRFFTTDSLYAAYLADGDWRPVYNEFVATTVPVGPARRLVGDVPGKDAEWYRNFSLDMYGMLQSLRVTDMGEPTEEWMTEGEYRACWETVNMNHYLKRSINSLTHYPNTAAEPLLRYLLDVPEGEVREVFGHAETLLPLLSLMRIPGGWYVGNDWSEVAGHWNDGDLSPLGGNIAIIFVRSKVSGTTYKIIYLNGEFVTEEVCR